MQVLCTFGINMLTFLSICSFCALLVVKIIHFWLLMQVLERYKSQNLQRVCNFEVNKAQIKNGIRFWFSCYFILLKNRNHQNTTNRMCIRHWNLQCFLSMSLNAFNTTLGKWYIPSLSGGPWGGLPYIYIVKCYEIQMIGKMPCPEIGRTPV